MQNKLSSASQTVRKGLRTLHEGSRTFLEGLFARNIATHFKLYAQMGYIIIYYVTNVFIAKLGMHIRSYAGVAKPKCVSHELAYEQ